MTNLGKILAAAIFVAAPVLVQAQTIDKSGSGGMTDLISMSKAVAEAEKSVSGRALEAELDWEKGQLVYEVEVVSGDALHKVHVDAASGEVVGSDRERLEGMWQNWFGSDKVKAVQSAPQSLAQLIESVEKDSGDRVTDASIDKKGDRYFYEMELHNDAGQEREVMVSLADGRIMTAIDD